MVFPWISFLQEVDDDLGNFVQISFSAAGTSGVGNIAMKYDPDIGDTILTIATQTVVDATTLHSSDTLTDLEVPTGKKWSVILQFQRGSVNFTFKVRASATVNTNDGTVEWDQSHALITGEESTTTRLELTAGEFLTMEVVTGNGSCLGGLIVESAA